MSSAWSTKVVYGVVLAMLTGGWLGCQTNEGDVMISGRVTHAGKPVPHLFLRFEAEGELGAFGESDEQGRFSMRTNYTRLGVIPGEYRVWVSCQFPEPDPEVLASGQWSIPDYAETIENKYGQETSQLTVQITASTDQLELAFD